MSLNVRMLSITPASVNASSNRSNVSFDKGDAPAADRSTQTNTDMGISNPLDFFKLILDQLNLMANPSSSVAADRGSAAADGERPAVTPEIKDSEGNVIFNPNSNNSVVNFVDNRFGDPNLVKLIQANPNSPETEKLLNALPGQLKAAGYDEKQIKEITDLNAILNLNNIIDKGKGAEFSDETLNSLRDQRDKLVKDFQANTGTTPKGDVKALSAVPTLTETGFNNTVNSELTKLVNARFPNNSELTKRILVDNSSKTVQDDQKKLVEELKAQGREEEAQRLIAISGMFTLNAQIDELKKKGDDPEKLAQLQKDRDVLFEKYVTLPIVVDPNQKDSIKVNQTAAVLDAKLDPNSGRNDQIKAIIDARVTDPRIKQTLLSNDPKALEALKKDMENSGYSKEYIDAISGLGTAYNANLSIQNEKNKDAAKQDPNATDRLREDRNAALKLYTDNADGLTVGKDGKPVKALSDNKGVFSIDYKDLGSNTKLFAELKGTVTDPTILKKFQTGQTVTDAELKKANPKLSTAEVDAALALGKTMKTNTEIEKVKTTDPAKAKELRTQRDNAQEKATPGSTTTKAVTPAADKGKTPPADPAKKEPAQPKSSVLGGKITPPPPKK